MEIEDRARIGEILRRGQPLTGLRLQALDLREFEPELLARTDVAGLVILGGQLGSRLERHLIEHGALVFPTDPSLPINPYRARLYTADELYAGIDVSPYRDTPDARTYRWARNKRSQHDAYATLLRATHDDSITDALTEFLRGRSVVGVMGSHGELRGSPAYVSAATLGFRFAQAGLVVATGGGPGVMEAVNLGASAPSAEAVHAAIERVREHPDFHRGVTGWARAAFRAIALWDNGSAQRTPHRSLGIPTWFYGHEPPNPFAQGIAKYFSNALREDGLIARATAGVVVLPGAAGTVQEIFQAATRLYYPNDGATPPLVLVGRATWTREIPVWPVLQQLAAGRPMADAIHLADSVDEAAALIAAASRP